ncbi:MAG: 3-dehydroquinate synthase [Fimbriimonadaceae bacterium]|nr:MAG: 3-dehydroquinate synthase [Fimbriimonadaceae bacterium]
MQVKVNSGSDHYSVGATQFDKILEQVTHRDIVITDNNLTACYPSLKNISGNLITIPAGEESKSFDQYEKVVEQIFQSSFLRNGTIFAIGGGVVGDLAGFVAATVHRGVRFVQVPTSLLAMVDSSVGGKVGIDLRHGKNLLGSFYNPAAVYIDPAVLQTLPVEHFQNGMAEVIKYGWILDTELLEILNQETLTATSRNLQEIVFRCVALKCDVVEEDFTEKSGLRAILNFGHTVGHALEAQVKYKNLLHGQAIAIGMVAEVAIANELGLSQLRTQDIEPLFQQYQLPICPTSHVNLDQLISLMLGDKKSTGNGIAMSLVLEPGQCKLVDNIDPALVRRVLANIWS